MNLYRGYVKGNGKGAGERFKDVPLHSLEEVRNFDAYGGILADNVVLLDVDNMEMSETLMDIVETKQMNCRVYQTKKGRHFLFQNAGIEKCGTGKHLACGLVADVKTGGNYHCMKVDGEERFIEWDSENGEYDPIPKWLFSVKSEIDFSTMKAGDGRNEQLFKYILTLTGAGFTKEESRETLQIINDYMLGEPLSEDELAIIMRDEAFPKETFFEGKAFLHNNFAWFLKNNDNIRRIDGQLHVFRDGVYIPGSREISAKMIQHLPMLKDSQRVEVLKYLDIICRDNEESAEARYIAFRNGVLDISTMELNPFDPSMVITNKIPWNYNPQAYSELADKTLDMLACNDPAVRALLEECIGYCFYRRNEMSKAFVLTGDKSNGKSTFLDVVKNVLGEQNYSALDLAELDERFSVATMSGKLANIGDDISDDFLQGRSVANFKKLVSGNQVKAEVKNDPNVFFMKPTVKLLFSANDIPRMKDKTGAVLRRLVIIPFNAKFSKDDPDFDPYITYKLREEAVMEYMVRIGINALRRVLETKKFTTSDKVQKELEEYEVQNNPILLFLEEGLQIENQPTKDVYRAYGVFCSENGFTEMTLANFSKEIIKRLGLSVSRRRVNGVLTQFYVKG